MLWSQLWQVKNACVCMLIQNTEKNRTDSLTLYHTRPLPYTSIITAKILNTTFANLVCPPYYRYRPAVSPTYVWSLGTAVISLVLRSSNTFVLSIVKLI